MTCLSVSLLYYTLYLTSAQQSAEPKLSAASALLSLRANVPICHALLRVISADHVCLFSVCSETEMTYSLQILLELEMDMKGSGANPFASLKPEVVDSCAHKPPVYCNSHYFCFQGLLEAVEFEEPEDA